MTKGEYRVGIGFNPSGNDTVGQIKRQAADLIDLVDNIDDGLRGWEQPQYGTPNGERAAEIRRLKALAQTHIEDAAMWAVKAATKQPKE